MASDDQRSLDAEWEFHVESAIEAIDSSDLEAAIKHLEKALAIDEKALKESLIPPSST